MSYILDALRRADAEREQGEVPGLHTQQYGLLPGDDEAPRRPLLLIGVIVVLALALAGMLAWNFLAGEPALPRGVAPGPVTAAPLPTMQPAPLAAALPATSSSGPAIAPSAQATSTPVGRDAASPASAKDPALAAPIQARRASRKASAAASTAALPPESRASSEGRVYSQAELPDAIRHEIPKLAFGGASYSKDAASRMVILNGQVFHEGDTIAPGLVLRQINLKAALLSYKSYRFELGY